MIKKSFIKQIGKNKFRVYSEKGRNLGTYESKEKAKKRLKQIEFFKHKNNLDDNFSEKGNIGYSDVKKKINSARLAKDSLFSLGLKKESSDIRRSIKEALMLALLSLGLAGDAYQMRDISSNFIKEEFNAEEKKMSKFPVGTSIEKIIFSLYPDINLKGKEYIVKELIVEYNPLLKFSIDGKLMKGSGVSEEEVIVYYPDIKKIISRFSQVLSSGYDSRELGLVGEMKLSPEAEQDMLSTEGFEPKIYNDNKKLIWPKDKKEGAGHWTIGYGHKLTKDELSTGFIKLKNGKKIPWSNGISKEQALLIKRNDLIVNSLMAAGISEDYQISRAMFEALTDLSFNVGAVSLSKIIESIKDESGSLSADLFAKEISGWTKVNEPSQRKGILVRRISELLTAKGVLLPEDPDHVLEDSISIESNMRLPSKEVVYSYLSSFDNNKVLSEKEVELILKALSKNPPNSASEFVSIVRNII